MRHEFNRGLRPTERREMFSGEQNINLELDLDSPKWSAIYNPANAPEIPMPSTPAGKPDVDLTAFESTPADIDLREPLVEVSQEAKLILAAMGHYIE